MTVALYARRKNWPLEAVTVRLRHSKIHAADCADCETKEGMLDHIESDLEFAGAVYWRFWQGQLLPYARQARCALYAKLAKALFLKALPQVVDSTAGDAVQLVRTLPCRWLESHTVTAISLTCSTKRTIPSLSPRECSGYLRRGPVRSKPLSTERGKTRR